MVKKKLKNSIFVLSFLLLFILSLFSIFVGQYKLSFFETLNTLLGDNLNNTARNIIYNIRVPRTISAILIGGALSVAGITYQNVFRNSIASQDILGASSGACIGASIGILLNMNSLYIQLLAFITGCLTIGLTYFTSSFLKMNKSISLLLSGILIGGVMSSILSLIKYLADPMQHLQTIVFWTMGDISNIDLIQIIYILPFLTIGIFTIYLLRWKLNYFAVEDYEAVNMGINITLYRNIFICASTMLISACVSVAGSIGWIGLTIPQLVRLIIGNNNEDSIKLTLVFGSCFLLTIDLINRLISSAEIPVSVISGFIGLPLFIFCIILESMRK